MKVCELGRLLASCGEKIATVVKGCRKTVVEAWSKLDYKTKAAIIGILLYIAEYIIRIG